MPITTRKLNAVIIGINMFLLAGVKRIRLFPDHYMAIKGHSPNWQVL